MYNQNNTPYFTQSYNPYLCRPPTVLPPPPGYHQVIYQQPRVNHVYPHSIRAVYPVPAPSFMVYNALPVTQLRPVTFSRPPPPIVNPLPQPNNVNQVKTMKIEIPPPATTITPSPAAPVSTSTEENIAVKTEEKEEISSAKSEETKPALPELQPKQFVHRCLNTDDCQTCRHIARFLQAPPYPEVENPKFGEYGVFSAPLDFVGTPMVELKFSTNRRIFPIDLQNKLKNRPTPPMDVNLQFLLKEGAKVFQQIDQITATNPDDATTIKNFILKLNLPSQQELNLMQAVRSRQQLVAATENSRPMTGCTFCRNRGESVKMYTSHTTLDSKTGIVICPYLRAEKCSVSALLLYSKMGH